MAKNETATEWKQDLLSLYGEGGSDVEAAKVLGITFARFEQMYLEHPAFAEIIDNCRTISHAWWVEKARTNLYNKDFNVALWNFNMKNRYGWADKSEIKDEKSARDMDMGQLRTEIMKKMPAFFEKFPELHNHLALVKTSKGDTDGAS